ncbi:MAG TPA: phnA protein [Thermodesulfobacteriaceae bacterium]|nr:phnA protein [Thermodesulfobacteriaceae bacterium]
MAKGLDRYQARQDAISTLGKTLVRRSGSRCELCGASGRGLTPMELEPLPPEPDPEHTILVCTLCREGIEGGKLDPKRWRFLESAVWSDIPPVQVAAIRMCRQLSTQGVEWAGTLLNSVYVSPELEEWLESS